MGRSQVERNRAARGRGGGGGGGRGRGRGGGRRQHKKIIVDGDNSFRYSNTNTTQSNTNNDAADDDYTSWLFEESAPFDGTNNFFLGDDDDVGNESEALVSVILNRSMDRSQSHHHQKQQHQQQQGVSPEQNIMLIDIKQLNECFKQIPIHQRLQLPHYIGRHLEDRYGLGVGGRGRENEKKTLAQLREESRCIIRDDEDDHYALEGLTVSEADTEQSKPTLAARGGEKSDEGDSSATDRAGAVAAEGGTAEDDNEEDLEAWLDDMIA
ncbi:hypothetical protein ACHAXH_005666 [Discostella pseudostelligera]